MKLKKRAKTTKEISATESTSLAEKEAAAVISKDKIDDVTPSTATDGAFTAPTKRKRQKDSVQDELSENMSKRKKKKRSGDSSQAAIIEQPEGEYVVGALSCLFGGGSTSTSSEPNGVSVFKGETVIKPKKAKIVEAQCSSNDDAVSREESREEKSRKDRNKQRENRKKAHEQKMTLEEKKRTLFVGNAPLSMDERECKKLFSQYGAIESVRMRSVMPNKETITKRIAHISHSFHEKQTALNFYVKFKDEESVQKALAYNGTILDKHRIRVDTCTSKAEYDRKMTVFVGNLPLDANEDELADLFEDNVGGVSFTRCVKDRATGMGKGFAFVVFKSPSSVPLALSLTGLLFHKRELRITKVMKKNKISKVQQARRKSTRDNQSNGKLNTDQLSKISKYKFSTRKPTDNKSPTVKKKVRKAIQRRKQKTQTRSIMQ